MNKFSLILLFFYCCSAAAQQQEDVFAGYFSRPEPGGKLKRQDYFLIKTESVVSPEKLTQPGLQVIRKLSDHYYIVEGKTQLVPGLLLVKPANDLWKLSPSLLSYQLTKSGLTHIPETFFLVVSDTFEFKKQLPPGSPVIKKMEYISAKLIVISTSFSYLVNNLLPLPSIVVADIGDKIPKEEQVINGFDLTANKVNLTHANFPSLNAEGLTVSIKENRPDTADIDFKGRYTSSPYTAATLSNHATIMATIIAGGGNSFHLGQGVAWGANFLSTNFFTLLPETDSFYSNAKISVQNHSYGTGIENFYGVDAWAYDGCTFQHPHLLHVFSAGNSGNLFSSSGTYAGLTGYANITGSAKMAKNIITVGSVDSFGVVSSLSSKGPAYDGRIKPELVAFGEDGSSGAAAIVSGISLLLQDAYEKDNEHRLPEAALVKAVLINSAEDVGNAGPDFKSGYGNVNAWQAVKTIKEKRYFQGSVDKGETNTFQLDVPEGAEGLKLTLVWTDPPAEPNAYFSLVNDLDLQCKALASGETWLPWVLQSFPHPDSLSLPALRGRDSINNIEQISITHPQAGRYQLSVSGEGAKSRQNFYLVYQWDTVKHFIWTYPASTDNLIPGDESLLRWQTNITGKAALAFSADLGKTWITQDSSVNPGDKFYRWNVDDHATTGLLRLTINNQQFVSDTFTLSSPVDAKMGFVCSDSLLVHWKKEDIGRYTLFTLGEKYLQPVKDITDTLALLHKTKLASKYLAVATKPAGNKYGIKGYTFNYETQGIACFVQQFLADATNDNQYAKISLQLGTTFGVKSVEIQKKNQSGYTTIRSMGGPAGLNFNMIDSSTQQGLNIYRARIERDNGTIILSQEETVFHYGVSGFVVFPNPLPAGQLLNILSQDTDGSNMLIYAMDGRKLTTRILSASREQVKLDLPRGMYIVQIIKKGKKDVIQKLVIK